MPSITLTFTAPQASLLAAAIGRDLALGRDATMAEAKFWFNTKARAVCENYERATAATSVTPTDMTSA